MAFDKVLHIRNIPCGLIILQGSWAVPPISICTFVTGAGLSIAAKELNLSTVDGKEVLMVGIAVVAT